MLSTEEMQVFYSDVQVLWGVSLSVEAGKTTVCIGPNGAGKSTLLKTVAGLLRPRKGKIIMEGEEIQRLSAAQRVDRGMSLVVEGRGLFNGMTVQENLVLGAFKSSARKNLKENLSLIYSKIPRLEERRNQLAGTLSGGEQQLLAVARALMAEPKLLLLDEPSSGLSPVMISEIYKLIADIGSEAKTTILLVEQNVRLALQLASSVYVMSNGRIVATGTKEELLANESIRKAYLGG